MIPLFLVRARHGRVPPPGGAGLALNGDDKRSEVRPQHTDVSSQQNGTTRRSSSVQVKIAALRPLPHSSRETERSAGARVRATARRGARLCRVPFSIVSPTRKSPRAVSHKNLARQMWPPNPTPRFPRREYSPPSIPIRVLLST